MQDVKHNIDSLALMNVPVDFDELFVCVLNELGPAYLNLSHALQVRETPVTFRELFEHLLNYEAQLRHSVPLASPASIPTTTMITFPSSSSHLRSNNRGGHNPNWSLQSWKSSNVPQQFAQPSLPTQIRHSQYLRHAPPMSPRHSAPPSRFVHSRYLGHCHTPTPAWVKRGGTTRD